jgi:hypothetical protein
MSVDGQDVEILVQIVQDLGKDYPVGQVGERFCFPVGFECAVDPFHKRGRRPSAERHGCGNVTHR